MAMFVGSLNGFSFDSSGFEKSAVRFRIFISSDPSVAVEIAKYLFKYLEILMEISSIREGDTHCL